MRKATVGLFLLALLLGCTSDARNITELKDNLNTVGPFLGETAPPFNLTTLDGEIIESKNLRGNKVVIAFFASWCFPCIQEARNLREALREVGDNITVMMVSLDSRESDEELRKFIEDEGSKEWKVGRATQNLIQKFKVRYLDTTIVLDEGGKVIYRDDGTPASKQTFLKVFEEV